jgi:hypothetical protein
MIARRLSRSRCLVVRHLYATVSNAQHAVGARNEKRLGEFESRSPWGLVVSRTRGGHGG